MVILGLRVSGGEGARPGYILMSAGAGTGLALIRWVRDFMTLLVRISCYILTPAYKLKNLLGIKCYSCQLAWARGVVMLVSWALIWWSGGFKTWPSLDLFATTTSHVNWLLLLVAMVMVDFALL